MLRLCSGIFLTLVLFASCSKQTTFERYIDNRSEDTLLVRFDSTDALVYGRDSLFALPKSYTRIFQEFDPERIKDYECVVFSPGSVILSRAGRQLIPDPTQSEDWVLVYNRPGNMWQCFFQIWEEDLQ